MPVRAQDSGDSQRGVARISLMEGQVSVQRGDSGDWVAGVINAPLITDDRIATGPNSRAEVQFDSANVLRIGGDALVRLTDLEYGRFQMELHHGTVTYRVLRPTTAEVEVDTPSVSVRPSKEGVYRINVNDTQETQLTVRTGAVEVFTPRGSQWVDAGQTMEAHGSPSDPEFRIVAAIPGDDWDRWSEGRDRKLLAARSDRYVPEGVYGAEDLDSYGSWNEVPPYGQVWTPTVAAGWAPYQYGRWAWEDWYGWTWMSYDPWGWAPFHYGRWFWQAPYGWCWYPGMMGVRHYWSPALVAFFGFGGGGGGLGFGFGNIGWVPLAPYEVFRPWWGRGFYGGGAYFGRNYNITNVNVANIYSNARVGHGITAVSAADFHSGRFNNPMHPAATQVREAGLVSGRMPIAPTAAHLSFANRRASFIPRTAGTSGRQFFTHQAPSSVERIPFAQQQRALAAGGRGNSGQPSHGPAASANGRQNASGLGGRSAAPRSPAVSTNGWRNYGDAAGRSVAPQTVAPRNEAGNGWRLAQPPAAQNTRPQASPGGTSGNRGGWQRFGDPAGGPRGSGAPRENFESGGFGGYQAPRNAVPNQTQQPLRIAPPVVRERPSTPSYRAPGNSAPRSYSAPRGGGGGRSSGSSNGRSSTGGSGRGR